MATRSKQKMEQTEFVSPCHHPDFYINIYVCVYIYKALHIYKVNVHDSSLSSARKLALEKQQHTELTLKKKVINV